MLLPKQNSKALVVALLITVVLPRVHLASVTVHQPFFVEAVNNVTVVIGRDATLTCVVENLEPYTVAWIHLDRQMIVTVHKHVVTRIPRFAVSHDEQRTWLLHIRGAQPEDAGRYMCQVNSEPMITQVGIVDVVVPPTILDAESSPSHITVREGSKITLSCRGEGFPMPKVAWRREDGKPVFSGLERKKQGPSIESEDLTFHKVSRTDSGAYLCIASNGVPPSVSKRILLEVEFAPMVWIPSQLVSVPVNSSVQLECHAEAQPRPIAYWVRQDGSRNDVMLLPNRRIKTEIDNRGYHNHMKLIINQTETADMGNYRCVAKNSLGEAEGSIRLIEMAPIITVQRRPQPSYQDNDDDNRLSFLSPDGKTPVTEASIPHQGSTPAYQTWHRGKKQSENYSSVPKHTSAPPFHSGSHRSLLSAPSCFLITLFTAVNWSI